ncbi:MAG TPA: hypothetical protein VGQ05_01935, partial [Streptosporangiaceae bacterium]|nr:hypothetical protein [Streptosporangiaceae bacterium]
MAPSPQRQTGAPRTEAREGHDHGRLPGGGRPVAVSPDGRTVYTAGAEATTANSPATTSSRSPT